MKSLILLFFVFTSSIGFSQNDEYNLYKGAIKIIKESSDFNNFVQENNLTKEAEIEDRLFPICGYCPWFGEYIKCCEQPLNLDNLFKNVSKISLKSLSDKGRKKVTIHFTSIENSYVVGRIGGKKVKNKSVTYLFKIEDKNISLVKTTHN